MVRITLDELRSLLERAENREKHGNMCGVLYVSIEHHSNGREYLQFEQPCSYADCNSNYYRYEGKTH